MGTNELDRVFQAEGAACAETGSRERAWLVLGTERSFVWLRCVGARGEVRDALERPAWPDCRRHPISCGEELGHHSGAGGGQSRTLRGAVTPPDLTL